MQRPTCSALQQVSPSLLPVPDAILWRRCMHVALAWLELQRQPFGEHKQFTLYGAWSALQQSI